MMPYLPVSIVFPKRADVRNVCTHTHQVIRWKEVVNRGTLIEVVHNYGPDY